MHILVNTVCFIVCVLDINLITYVVNSCNEPVKKAVANFFNLQL